MSDPAEQPMDQPAADPANPAKARKAMKETLRLVKKLGVGAAGLLGRLKKDKSPEAMMNTIDASLAANRNRREEVAGRVERLFQEIAEKKKAFPAAPRARQRVLEMELRSRLSEYKAAERELGVLLENERVLSSVRGRFSEVMAYDLRGIAEDVIEDVTDEIEDRAAEADGVLDAARDLEKAGRRRERDADTESLWTELDAFDEQASPALTDALADSDEQTPPTKAKEEATQPTRKQEDPPRVDDAE